MGNKIIKTRINPSKVLFSSNDNGYKVVAVIPESEEIEKNPYGNITIVGNNIPELQMGTWYDVELRELSHAKYKNTYEIIEFGDLFPQQAGEQWEYIMNILTPTQYSNVSAFYSRDIPILNLIIQDKFEYDKISGFGEKTFMVLKKKIANTRDISKLMAYFGNSATPHSLEKMLEFYGNTDTVIHNFEKRPYSFTKISGFGFKIVDKIALAKGADKYSRDRILSATHYAIHEDMLLSGDTFITKKDIYNKIQNLTEINETLIVEALNDLEGLREFDVMKIDDDRYTSITSFEAEKYIAEQIKLKLDIEPSVHEIDYNNLIFEFETKTGFQLSDEQKNVVYSFGKSGIMFIVGSAGSGKSSIQDITMEIANQLNLTSLLIAPTGRASKVMKKKTGIQAFTIHKAIYSQVGVVKSRNEDIVIVDETSMADIYLLRDLFKAFEHKPETIFVFIGDDSQIPSVSAGNFLHDIINSENIKINKLNKVFRQKDGGILDIATKTRNGEIFIGRNFTGIKKFGKNCIMDFRPNNDYITTIIKNYKSVLDKGFADVENIVILTPTNKGKYGTLNINKEIQKIVNPPSTRKIELEVGNKDLQRVFRVGDYVLNTQNKYELPIVDINGNALSDENSQLLESKYGDVFNGETGFIKNIVDGKIIVEIDDKMYLFDKSDATNTLYHAYALTIHKSQGGEYSVVMAVVDKSHSFQLNRNLLYTGFSRAKEYLLILGNGVALNNGINKSENIRRKTLLMDFLENNIDKKSLYVENEVK